MDPVENLFYENKGLVYEFDEKMELYIPLWK